MAARLAARLTAVVVLPTPPFWFATAMDAGHVPPTPPPGRFFWVAEGARGDRVRTEDGQRKPLRQKLFVMTVAGQRATDQQTLDYLGGS